MGNFSIGVALDKPATYYSMSAALRGLNLLAPTPEALNPVIDPKEAVRPA